jgi:hypothetical protein
MKGRDYLGKTQDVHFRIRPEVKLQIEAAAAQSGESISAYCNRVLADASGYDKMSEQQLGEQIKRRKGNIKNQAIGFRVADEDKHLIEEKAELANLSVGEYLIRSALGEQTIIVLNGKDILHQLSKIGTNLNQLTILTHQGKISCPNLDETNRVLSDVLKQMQCLMKGG